MSRKAEPRTLALRALREVERRDAYADAVLDGLLTRHPGLPPRDRSLVSHLVYGVLRWRNRLDAHIAQASDRPLRKMHPQLLEILRLGAYQILFLDRVPDRAAVHETAELARRSGLAHAVGFVNAVLRKIAASGGEILLPEDPAPRLSLLFGCPQWLVEAWMEEHGAEGAEALCRASSQIPALTLRIDTARLPRDRAVEELREAGLEAGPGRYAPEAVWVEGAGDPRGISLVQRGLAVVQDQASQLIAHVLSPDPGWRVLDACAGPGLKATQLGQRMGGAGVVVALDIHPARAQMVLDLANRLGVGSVQVKTADARTYDSEETFDGALVDAPCSGLGVLSRTPEAKWRRDPEQLTSLPSLQLAILEGVSRLIKQGGVLVYATCTTLKAENEAVVEEFVRRCPEFSLEPPPAGEVPWEGFTTATGYFRTYPHRVGEPRDRALDGFFAARLRRAARPGAEC